MNQINPPTPKILPLLAALCLQILLAGLFPLYGQVSCDTQIELALDGNCEGLVTPNTFLASDAADESLFTVTVIGVGTGPNVLVTSTGTYDVIVTRISNGNFCGPHTLIVTDELGPEIDCSTVYLNCGDPLPSTPPAATDGCCGSQVTFNSPFELSGVTQIDDFKGPFHTGNWNFTFDAAAGEDVSFSPAGNILTLLGDNVGPQNAGDPCNNPNPGNPLCYTATACITVPISGDVTFDWENSRATGSPGHAPDFDPSAYSITPAGGTIDYTVLSTASVTSGTVTNLALSAGDEFCFIIGSNGFNSFSETIINNFSFAPVAADACDEDYVLRQWTATDCNGAVSTCIQAVVYNDITTTGPADLTGANALDCATSFATDAAGNPDPSVTGVPVGCNISYSYNDIRVENLGCQGGTNIGCYKILRTWAIFDNCTNTKTFESQTIQVVDNMGPTVEGVADVTISTDSDACTATYYVPAPVLSDNCSDLDGYTINASAGNVTFLTSIQRYVITNAPLGTFTITYRAEDCCGNVTNETVNVTVEDLIPPSATCELIRQTNLTTDGTSLVQASAFDDGSNDGCSPTLWFKAIRMDNTNCATLNGDDNPGGSNDVWYDDEVFFCCEDLGDTVAVILRVFDVDPGTGPVDPSRMTGTGDLVGHFNECMSQTIVNNTQAPFVSCPPNITVSCEFWFDQNDLTGTFGDIVTNITDQQDIVINDSGNTAPPANNIWGQDGLAASNCSNLTITRDSVFSLSCGTGTITRLFTVTDDAGLSATCTQIITVSDFSPYIITDTDASNANPNDGVIWPANYSSTNINGCASDTDASVTGRPTILNDDACAVISVDSSDVTALAGGGFCRVINRTWIVTDLCNYPPANPVVNPGQWTYTQVISVTDGAEPVFDACPSDVTVAGYEFDANCEVLANLSTSATDNCVNTADLGYSWKVFLNTVPAPAGGIADKSGAGNTLSERLPLGTHSLVWSVKDLCGNSEDCQITVTVADSLNPVAKALLPAHAINLSTATNSALVQASKLNAGSFDSCGTIAQEIIAVPSGGPNQTTPPVSATSSFTFDCTNTGPFYPDTIPVDYWVQDLAGNWDYVTTSIIVQDNNQVCSGPAPSANVEGFIENELGASLGGVKVAVGDALFSFTDNGGNYMLADLPTQDNYQVTPQYDADYRHEVTGLDIVLISRHMLGIEILDSPYKLIAADVDNDGQITVFDILEIQKVLMYVNNSFPNNTSWRFIDADHVFLDPTDPFASTFPEIYDISNLLNDRSDINFIGLKVGDVNSTATTNAQGHAVDRNYDGKFSLAIEDALLEAGKTYTLDVKANNFEHIFGYQFSIGFDKEALEFVGFKNGSLPGLSTSNFGTTFLDEGIINAVWAQAQNLSLEDGEVLFKLEFKVNQSTTWQQSLWMTPGLIKGEAYSLTEQSTAWEILSPAFDFENVIGTNSNGFTMYPNKPNPFKEETVISFYFEENTNAKLTIYDLSGKELKVVEQTYAPGYHEQVISKTELAASGILYAKLETTKDFAIQKMILLD